MNHLAVVHRRYLDLILTGEKTVESRLSKVRCAPYGRIEPGDRIYFKESSGPVRASVVAKQIEHHENLTPTLVRSLKHRHNELVLGNADYWRLKSSARYAVLIWFAQVRPVADWPSKPALNGRGWLCLAPGDVTRHRRKCVRRSCET